jgi:Cytidylate kinase-like family
VVASRVAERLGWPMHNRAIPVEVAARLALPLEVALPNDEASLTRVGRLLARFSVQLSSEGAGHIPMEVFVGEESFQQHSESIIRQLASRSNCVIVGRAAAIVLAEDDNALHVRLDGSRDRRATEAARALQIPIEVEVLLQAIRETMAPPAASQKRIGFRLEKS